MNSGTDSNFLSTRVFYVLGAAYWREIQPITANKGDFGLELFVLPKAMLAVRRVMDKGILRFIAEAYFLLHSGTMAQAELKPERAQERHSKAVQTADAAGRKMPAQENRSPVKASKVKGGQNDGSKP
jgi:hypothetical protein